MRWLIGRQVSRLSRRQSDRYIVGFIGPAAGQFVGKEAGTVKKPENLSVAGNLTGSYLQRNRHQGCYFKI